MANAFYNVFKFFYFIFTQHRFHKFADACFSAFECDKDIFYLLDGFHNENAYFKKILDHQNEYFSRWKDSGKYRNVKVR